MNLRHGVKLLVARRPSLYFGLLGRSARLRQLGVQRGTDLVIEGFPRSGNTFAVVAFESAQPAPLSVAHHLHVPAQVLRAAAWQRPVLLLARQPADAVVSWLQRNPRLDAAASLREWIWFYEAVRPVLNECVVATFDQVTGDFGAVTRRVNARFGTAFAAFQHTPENVAAVFATIDRGAAAAGRTAAQVARPKAERADRQQAVRGRLEAPSCRGLLARADELYAVVAAAAPAAP